VLDLHACAAKESNENWGIAAISANSGVRKINAYWQSSKGAVSAARQRKPSVVHKSSAWAAIINLCTQTAHVGLASDRAEFKRLPFPGDAFASDFQVPSMRSFVNSPFHSRFALMDYLDKGNYGSVYIAQDRAKGCDVVVKVAVPKGAQEGDGRIGHLDATDWLEPWHLMKCQGANVVRLLDAFQSPGLIAMALEKLYASLYGFLQEIGPLKGEAINQLGLALFSGLARMHGMGCVNLDVHEKNILVISSSVADLGQAKLCDLGHSISVDIQTPVQISSNTFVPRHRPPELLFACGLVWGALGNRDPPRVYTTVYPSKSDVFAAGSTCLLAMGCAPLREDSLCATARDFCSLYAAGGDLRCVALRNNNKWCVPSFVQAIKRKAPTALKGAPNFIHIALAIDPPTRQTAGEIAGAAKQVL